jgi:hypothetical protein
MKCGRIVALKTAEFNGSALDTLELRADHLPCTGKRAHPVTPSHPPTSLVRRREPQVEQGAET